MQHEADSPHPLRVLEAEPGPGMQRLAELLRARRLPHQMFEERGLVVVVARAQDAALVRALHQQALEGAAAQVGPHARAELIPGGVQGLLRSAPATMAFVLTIVAVTFATAVLPIDRWLWFVDPMYRGPQPWSASLAEGQIWRLWTPVLMHGGPVHLLFNVLWLWEFGRRIEAALGAGALVTAMLVTGVAANISLYLWIGSAAFLGASGIACGLLGFLVVARRLHADPRLQLPPGLALAFVVMLLVMSSGVLDWFGVAVGNAAHWGGLVAGAALAPLFALRTRTPAR